MPLPDIITQKKHWTYADFDILPAELRCEIIGGELIMAPSPNTEHQSASLNLVVDLVNILRQKKLGRLFEAPMDVIFDEENTVQPDIIYIKNENAGIITKKCIEGVPDIVIEILSTGNVKYDRKEKFELYHRFKVPEYWIADPANQSIEIYEWTENHYELFALGEQKGEISSKIQPEFVIKLEEIFVQL